METVLGLSVTSTNVQTVLVEGRDADGITLEHDEFDVFTGAESPARASEQVAEAVLSIAEADGHRLHAIGVTWSQDADLQASLVLGSLADLGFDNVVPVRRPHAAEALARSIGKVIGYQRTAVCVVEPGTVVLALVDASGGEVESLVSPALADDQALLDWIATVFDRDGWRPEGMFVVGSVSGLSELAVRLEHGLGLPVFDPPEAELAVAHGAALASARSAGEGITAWYGYPSVPSAERRNGLRGPATMLVGGAVALVVSTALAVTPHLLPDRPALGAAPTAVRAELPTPPPARAVPAPIVPAPIEAAPVEQMPEQAVEVPVEQPPAEVPAYAPEPVTEVQQMVPPEPAPAVVPQAPVLAPQVPPAPQPRLRDRILDRIPGLDRFGDGE